MILKGTLRSSCGISSYLREVLSVQRECCFNVQKNKNDGNILSERIRMQIGKHPTLIESITSCVHLLYAAFLFYYHYYYDNNNSGLMIRI